MSNCENNSAADVPSVPDQELLRELMPKLGMKATEPKSRYRNQVWRRYFLPKVLLVIVAAVLLGCVELYLLTPSRLLALEVNRQDGRATVSFQVDHVMLLESVTAQLNDRPVTVQYVSPGSYMIDLERNGTLTITSHTFTGRQFQASAVIDSVDEEPPHISGHALEDGVMTICFSDSDGSGVDWTSLSACNANTGEPFHIDEIDEESGCIRFSFPNAPLRFTMEDKAGNPLSVLLEPVDEDGDQDGQTAP